MLLLGFCTVWMVFIISEGHARNNTTDVITYMTADEANVSTSPMMTTSSGNDVLICGGLHSGTYGEIVSPLYPFNYPNNYRCQWEITVPIGRRVAVTFISFAIEYEPSCSYDYLEVYLDGIYDELFDERLCGSNPEPLLSKEETLLMVFYSDTSETAKGFDIIWRAVDLLSIGKPTKQSSVFVVTGDPRVSGLAVDGNDNPYFNSGSCTHTHNDFEPWWRVDLEKSYAVQFVDITNRDAAGERLYNAEVRIGTNPSPHKVNPQCGPLLEYSTALKIDIRVDCGELMYGRYVSVLVVGRSEYMTICEVEVYGIDTDTLPGVNGTKDCSYSPGPCDDHVTDCSIPNLVWPTCACDASMFKCDNGRCIPMTYRCNMYDNCGDASDEYSCDCGANATVCVESRGSLCVASRFLCDGFDNCEDSSDENASCACAADEYKCTDDGRCLPLSKLCDHIADCKDGQDEENCITCDDATVVQVSRHCDGHYDCSDQRDERNCETPGCYVTEYGSRSDCYLPDATFSTFNYPHDYSPGVRCSWYIEIPSSSSFIQLTFTDFDIPSDELCQSDNVIVYNEDITSDNAIIGTFCNHNKPPAYLLSSRNRMVLVFSSDSSGSGRGFQATYTTESVVSGAANFNSSRCELHWTFYEDACYQRFSNPSDITWTDAKRECEMLDSHLVFITTRQEMEFIHYMLTNLWLSEETETYIGLSNRLSVNGVYSWSNGSPLSYTAWYITNGQENVVWNQPKAGDLEQCTLIWLDTFHSLQQWKEVACEFPTTGQYICKYQLDDAWHNATLGIGLVEKSVQGCYSDDFQCDSQECIHEVFVCDGKTDCKDGSDERNCEDACDQGGFECKDKQCIPVSFVCDFVHHCRDMSDEIDCHYPNCTDKQFKCESGQCIASNQRCDLLTQCVDASDERECDICSSGFQCYDGSCLPTRAVCDATNDCPGDTVEDEIDCGYWENRTCSDDNMSCKNGECSLKRYKCLYDPDEYDMQKGCRDVSHLEECDNFKCPVSTIKCPEAYCIVERLRCNSIWDCPNGEDEQDCDLYTCPYSYKCRSSGMCVSQVDRCNGVDDCPEGDDELFCGYSCPPGCSCRGLEITCKGIAWNYTASSAVHSSTRYLNLTDLKITVVTRRSTGVTIKKALLIDIEQFSLLVTADFSSNGIQEILPNTFINQVNMKKLVLSKNNIINLSYGAFNGLRSLQFLYIDNNGLMSVDSGVFAVLPVLEYLYMQGNTLTTFQDDVFYGLNELRSLSSDDFLFCCIVGNIEHCDPPADQFSSCEDLMKNSTLRILMWILGISALVGNAIVIVWRVYSKDYRNVQSILITNLAASDYLMGMYMIIIAGADLYYRGRYARFADDWKSSFLCNFAGALSTLSSEFSVFILVVMSLDRAVAVAFPFGTFRLNRKRCLIMLTLAWVTVILISFLPMFNIPYFGEHYYGRPSVCLALPLTGDRIDGWEYSIAIFLGFNLFGFLIIAISYVYIYITVKRAAASVTKSQANSNELKMATKMAVIVFTDFCCWFPIILMGIVSQAGVWQIPVEIYVWSATLIMPINSSINPYLYTIPYICEARRRKMKKSVKVLSQSIQLHSDSKKIETTLVDKITQDVERNRILPLLSVAISRPYTLSALLVSHANKNTESKYNERIFTNEELAQIQNDLTKALQFLHRSNLVHGNITEEFVIVHTDKGYKRAFLIDTPTSIANTTDGATQEQDFDQLKRLMETLRQTKKNIKNHVV